MRGKGGVDRSENPKLHAHLNDAHALQRLAVKPGVAEILQQHVVLDESLKHVAVERRVDTPQELEHVVHEQVLLLLLLLLLLLPLLLLLLLPLCQRGHGASTYALRRALSE
jgi:hypothetical protein